MRPSLACLSTLWLFAACAHTSASSSKVDPLVVKSAAEQFHRRVRWKDFRGASDVIVPERRQAFLTASETNNDERDLSVSDYELLELRVAEDGTRAWVVSRISWSRLPSISVETQTVTSELVRAGEVWFVARQDRGPFAETLSAPYEPAGAP